MAMLLSKDMPDEAAELAFKLTSAQATATTVPRLTPLTHSLDQPETTGRREPSDPPNPYGISQSRTPTDVVTSQPGTAPPEPLAKAHWR